MHSTIRTGNMSTRSNRARISRTHRDAPPTHTPHAPAPQAHSLHTHAQPAHLPLICIWVDSSIAPQSLAPYKAPISPSIASTHIHLLIAGGRAYVPLIQALATLYQAANQGISKTGIQAGTHISILFICKNRDKAEAHFLAHLIGTEFPKIRIAILSTNLSPSIALSFASQAGSISTSLTQTINAFYQLSSITTSGILTRSPLSYKNKDTSFFSAAAATMLRRTIALISPQPRFISPSAFLSSISPQRFSIFYVGTDEKLLKKYWPFLRAFVRASALPQAPLIHTRGIEFYISNGAAPLQAPSKARCPHCSEPLYAEYCPVCHIRSDSLQR